MAEKRKAGGNAYAVSRRFTMSNSVYAGQYKKIVLVAPPAALGILRKALDRQVWDHIIAEVGKDLTRQPVPDIEKALSG